MRGISDHERFSNIAGGLSSYATILALLIGGAWAFNEFVLTRELYPKVNVEHEIDAIRLSDQEVLLRVTASLENTGSTYVSLTSGSVHIESVRPLSDVVVAKAAQYAGLDPKGPLRISWPALAVRDLEWLGGELEIEPGETETIYFEFLLPPSQQVINVYTFFTNDIKTETGRSLGWNRSTLYSLSGV